MNLTSWYDALIVSMFKLNYKPNKYTRMGTIIVFLCAIIVLFSSFMLVRELILDG